MHFQRALLCRGRKLFFSHSSRHNVRYFFICLTVTVTRDGDETKPVWWWERRRRITKQALRWRFPTSFSLFYNLLISLDQKVFPKIPLISHSELSIIRRIICNFLTLYIAFPHHFLPCLSITSSAILGIFLRALFAKSTPQPPRFRHPLHGHPATISSTLRSLIRFPIRLRTSRSLSKRSWLHCRYRELEVGPRGWCEDSSWQQGRHWGCVYVNILETYCFYLRGNGLTDHTDRYIGK